MVPESIIDVNSLIQPFHAIKMATVIAISPTIPKNIEVVGRISFRVTLPSEKSYVTITTMNSLNNTKKITMSALMAALALIFSYIEVLIPFSIGIPGIKLGIANLVIIIALYYLGARYAFTINVIRVLIAGLLFNGLFGALYSLSGAITSMLIMMLLKRTSLFSIVGVSMAGGVAHNLGQILVAAFLISNIRIFIYFPVLIISGVVSGTIIGILSHLILQKLPKERL